MGAQLETDSRVEWGGGAREECVLCVPGIGSFKWILSELKLWNNLNWILLCFTRNLQVPALFNTGTSGKSREPGSVSKVRLWLNLVPPCMVGMVLCVCDWYLLICSCFSFVSDYIGGTSVSLIVSETPFLIKLVVGVWKFWNSLEF